MNSYSKNKGNHAQVDTNIDEKDNDIGNGSSSDEDDRNQDGISNSSFCGTFYGNVDRNAKASVAIGSQSTPVDNLRVATTTISSIGKQQKISTASTKLQELGGEVTSRSVSDLHGDKDDDGDYNNSGMLGKPISRTTKTIVSRAGTKAAGGVYARADPAAATEEEEEEREGGIEGISNDSRSDDSNSDLYPGAYPGAYRIHGPNYSTTGRRRAEEDDGIGVFDDTSYDSVTIVVGEDYNNDRGTINMASQRLLQQQPLPATTVPRAEDDDDQEVANARRFRLTADGRIVEEEGRQRHLGHAIVNDNDGNSKDHQVSSNGNSQQTRETSSGEEQYLKCNDRTEKCSRIRNARRLIMVQVGFVIIALVTTGILLGARNRPAKPSSPSIAEHSTNSNSIAENFDVDDLAKQTNLTNETIQCLNTTEDNVQQSSFLPCDSNAGDTDGASSNIFLVLVIGFVVMCCITFYYCSH